MLSLDGTFLVMFFSFILFMLLMKSIYFGPIMKIKHERENTIEAGQNAAKDAAEKTEKVSQEYRQQLAEARRKAQQLVQEKREWAKGKASEHVTTARQQSLSEIDAQSAKLNELRDNIYQTLQQEREALSKTIVQKISMGRQTTTAGAPKSPAF